MSGLPLDEPAEGAYPVDSAVLQQLDVPEVAARPLRTDELEWREVRDALWLAGQLRSVEEPAAAAPTAEHSGPVAAREPASPRIERPSEPAEPAEDHRPQRDRPAPIQPRDWQPRRSRLIQPTIFDRDSPDETAPLMWPAIPALPNGRGIVRALRPLQKTAPSPHREVLDEQATAEHAAQTGAWLPRFRPENWHELELVVVVDTAGAMDIWNQTVRELCELFRRLGAFRNVRTLFMDCSRPLPGQITLRTARSGGVSRNWRDEVDPTGRRLFLVLTDSIGDGWRSGAATCVVGRWARSAPTAIVQLLPQRLWYWGGLSPRRIKLRATARGAPNARFGVESRDGLSISDALAIPVLGLEPEWWSGWVKLLAGPDSGWVDSTAILTQAADRTADEYEEPTANPERPSAYERITRFRTFASVQAFQLAGLLAAAPLSVATMKLVQRVLLPGSDLAAVAEVLLGGLLRRVSAQPDPNAAANYEFHDGVREELLASGHRTDTIRVARLLTGPAGPGTPAMRNFREALETPDSTPEPDVSLDNRPDLQVQEAVLRALSGPYAPRARRLRGKLGIRIAKQPAEPVPLASNTIIPDSTSESFQMIRTGTVTITEAQPPSDPEVLSPASEGGEVTVIGSTHSVDSGASTGRQPRVWGPVPLRNPDFVGREELLDNLRGRLFEPGGATAVLPEALHGMGGVGKSQTVVEYIYRHATEYELVWWIPAEHNTQIRASFVELAKKLGLPTGVSAETTSDAVLEALRNGEPCARWILVFDNAERPDVVRPYLPNSPFLPDGFGHVVVTSRNSEWAGVARTVAVDLFTRDESMELLRRRGGEISNTDADKLAEALGDLPLAVEQAATWRAQTGMQVAEYLRLLDENSAELLKAGAAGDYELPVAAAWNVPLNRLRTDRREALELLQVCAFFGPEPISRSLFTGIREAPVPDALREAFADSIRLNHAIREISKYSLAKIDHRNNTLQLHRLVQAVLRDQLDPEQQTNMRHAVHLMLVSDDPDNPENAASWPLYGSLLPHALSAQAVDCQDNWVRQLVNNLVRYLLSSGDYHGALQLAEQAWQARTETLGESHLDTLTMGRHRGAALRRVGKVNEAQAANETTYEQMLKTLGEDHEATIAMADTMGLNFRARGLLFQERDLAERTLDRARRVLGQEDPETLFYANNLAACYRLTGEYYKARELDERTLRSRTVVLGEEHPATLNTHSCLAMDARECGEYVQACEMQEATRARLIELIGPDHPVTIGGTRCLAVARRKSGFHNEAMALTEECYDRYRRRHGEVHVDTATGLMDMAIELRHLGDLERSRKFGMLSVERFAQVYDASHPFALIAATNLAVTSRLVGDVVEARQLNERAVAGFVEKLDKDHPYTLVAAANLASDLAELGELERARDADVDTLERCTRTLSETHPTTLAVAHNLSIDLNALGQTNEAAILHTKTVATFRQVLGEDHPATKSANKNVRANCDTDTMQL
jgi:tetratricopeptide (TPR) repeat protein